MTNENINSEEEIANVPEKRNYNFEPKEKYYIKSIDRFFSKIEENKINKMIDIIKKKSRITLRLLDWFITIYSKRKNISYEKKNKNKNNELGNKFYVNLCYKAQLKTYKKRYFDPFRRNGTQTTTNSTDNNNDKDKGGKFIYTFKNGKKICTTICQLNFFKWVFENEIVEYIDKNYDTIIKCMKNYNKDKKSEKKIKNKNKKEKKKSSNDKDSNSSCDMENLTISFC